MKKSFSNFPDCGNTPALKITPFLPENGMIPIKHPCGGADTLSAEQAFFERYGSRYLGFFRLFSATDAYFVTRRRHLFCTLSPADVF
jgi:hypothetical protein